MNPLKLIDGWKTEIGLVAIAASFVALKMQWLSPEHFEWMLAGLGTWTGLSIKHAVRKSGSGE